MINSREKWNIEYMKKLRNKFVDKGYPLKLINGEFKRALEVVRKDLLLFNTKKKKNKLGLSCAKPSTNSSYLA